MVIVMVIIASMVSLVITTVRMMIQSRCKLHVSAPRPKAK